MKIKSLGSYTYEGLGEAGEREYISSVNMDTDYRVSPEAGNISYILCGEDESENWFVRQVSPKQRLATALNKKKNR